MIREIVIPARISGERVGILYDTTVVDPADLQEGWDLLRDTKYKGNIYMYDSERDSFMIALKALGYSMNTTDENQIQEAYQWLVDQRNTMDPIYAGDDVIDNMIPETRLWQLFIPEMLLIL